MRGRRDLWVGLVGTAVMLGLTLPLVIALLARPATGIVASPAPAPGRETQDPNPYDRHPNIVVIVSDDQRWDTLWAMPKLRRLLGVRGVTFREAFVTNPLCCPSRASILTGRYSHGTGVYTNHAPLGGVAAFDPAGSIAVRLRRSGYRTGLFGKYLNQYRGGVPPGWDRWAAFDSGGSGTAYEDPSFHIGDVARRLDGYSTDLLAGMASSFIRTSRRPFFLYVAPSAPHLPADPAARHASRFAGFEMPAPPSFMEPDTSDKPPWLRSVGVARPARIADLRPVPRLQLASLQAVDDLVARVVGAVRDRGELDRTMFVYLSDNGFLWGEHRLKGKSVPYEESIRIPMVVRYDPLTRRGWNDDRMVLNIDLAPTFADLAGIPLPDADGVSLLPLLRTRSVRGRAAFLIEHIATPTTKAPTYCAVRERRWKYVLYEDGSQELYDLRADPFELRNLIGRSRADGAWTRLGARLTELCDPVPPGFTGLDRPGNP